MSAEKKTDWNYQIFPRKVMDLKNNYFDDKLLSNDYPRRHSQLDRQTQEHSKP